MAVKGTQTARINKSEVRQLLDDIKRVGFFELPDRIGMDIAPADAPRAEISVTTSAIKKTVLFHYYADHLKELLYLRTRILGLVNAKQWLCPVSTQMKRDCFVD